MGGRHFQRLGPSPTLGSLWPSHNGATSPGCHSRVPLTPMILQVRTPHREVRDSDGAFYAQDVKVLKKPLR